MTRERRIGMGILAGGGLLLLIVGGMLMAQEARSLKYTILFNDGKGLNVGDRVQLTGVDIGVVREVVLHAQPAEVEVRVKIAPKHSAKVRSDSTAIISNTSFPNVSGQRVVEIINPESTPPPPPMQTGAVIKGLNGVMDLTAWKVKRSLVSGAGSVKEKMVQAQEGIQSAIRQINELRTSPEAREAVGALKAFADKMRIEGKTAVGQLAAEWPVVKAKLQPVLTQLKAMGKQYVVDQLRRVMDQVDETLNRWRSKAPEPPAETPGSATPEPSQSPLAPEPPPASQPAGQPA